MSWDFDFEEDPTFNGFDVTDGFFDHDEVIEQVRRFKEDMVIQQWDEQYMPYMEDIEEHVSEEELALRQMRRNDAKHVKGEIIDDPYMHQFDLETYRAKFDEDRNRSNQRVAEKACLYRDMTLEELNEEQKRLHEDRKERRRNFREMNEDWADDEEY